MPAIDVFEVGGAYFVEDGHHRVASRGNGGAPELVGAFDADGEPNARTLAPPGA